MPRLARWVCAACTQRLQEHLKRNTDRLLVLVASGARRVRRQRIALFLGVLPPRSLLAVVQRAHCTLKITPEPRTLHPFSAVHVIFATEYLVIARLSRGCRERKTKGIGH